MKWIGQHVWDYISRFRNDVFLEDISSGTIASGGNLGLDSNNKIVKAAVSDGDITGVTAGTGLSGGGTSGAVTLNVDAAQTQITSVGTIGTGVWQGTAINQTYLVGQSGTNTGDEDQASINALGITTVGTITTGVWGGTDITRVGTIGAGVWQGTAIATAYIADDAITENKLDNTLLAEIDDNTAKATNVTTNLTATTHASQITINSSDGTNVVVAEASGSIAGVMTVAHHDKLDGIETSATADQTRGDIEGLEITTVGTVSTGVWQGTAVASAYLDADTAHYSATRQVTHHMITDDIDSDVIYISLGEIDSEGTSATGKHLPLIAPTAGKLLKIFLRTSVNYSSETFTWKLYTRNVSASTGGAPTEIGAQSGAGPTNKTMVTYDFTSSLDSGTNAIAAGDKVQISIEAGDGATANGNYFITCLWEWDLS